MSLDFFTGFPMVTRVRNSLFFGLWLVLVAVLPLSATNTPTQPREPELAFSEKELAQGYRESVVLAKPRAAHRTTAQAEEEREGLRVRHVFERFDGLRVIELGAGDTADRAIARLRATGRYEYVEADRIRQVAAVPSDPSFGQLWGLNNTGQSSGAAGADIRAVAAWDIIREAPNVIVAVIDSGVNVSHTDIAGNLWRNPSPSSSLNDVYGARATSGNGRISGGSPDDDNGHGTHVAGTIGAVGNNGSGICGVAWKVQIMALKFLSGTTGRGATSDGIACIDYAINHGAHIINASYGEAGGSPLSQSELDAIGRAREAGIIFVAAAGNDASNMDVSPHYPASLPLDNIVAVGASTRLDDVAPFSNTGAIVDLFAPGYEIVSLDYARPNGGLANKSGTSMAAPHVSGALALLKARFPGDTYRQLINRLLRGADPGAGRFVGRSLTGGRLNLLRALSTDTNRPFNDHFGERPRLGGSNVTVRANNSGATTEGGEPAHAGLAAASSLWWEWTAAASGNVTVTTQGSDVDTVVAVYSGGTLGGLSLIGANNDANATTRTSRVEFVATAGATYQIVVGSAGSGTGSIRLSLGARPDNDAFATPFDLRGPSASVAATNAQCTTEAGEPRILGNAGGTSLWYRWTAPKSGRFQASVHTADFDPLLAVYTGEALDALTLVVAGDNTGFDGSQLPSLCTFEAKQGVTYRFAVDSKNAATTGEYVFSIVDSLWQAVTGSNGKEGDSVTGSPAVGSDGAVYFGSTDNNVYAINPDGSLRWRYETGGLIDTCSPAIGIDGTVIVGSNDGTLRAFDPVSGALRWSHAFGTGIAVSNSPAVATDGTLYVKPSDGFLYALNPYSGDVLWKYDCSAIGSYASAAVAADGTVYQGSDDKKLYALNPDGTLKWSFTAENEIYTVPAIDASGNLYFGVLGTGKLYSLTSAGQLRWVYSGATAATTSSPALSADGRTVYFAAYDRRLHAVNTADGTGRWIYGLENEVRASSPAVGEDGTVYVGAYDRRLYAIAPNGTLRRTYDTGGWIRSCPAIAGRTLYVGSNDRKLYAFDIGQGPAAGEWAQYRHDARRTGRSGKEEVPKLGRIVNLSVRATAGADAQNLIVGFVVSGGASVRHPVLVRAIGPSLAQYGVGSVLPDPRLTLYRDVSVTAENGNWGGGDTLRRLFTQTGAFPLEGDSLDAALSVSLAPGLYTAQVAAASGAAAGTVLAELYDADPTPPGAETFAPIGRLVNVSTRTYVGTGAQVPIIGFAINGNVPRRLLLRAIGPGLFAYGVTSGLLQDPRIELYRGTSPVHSNDNWSGAAHLIKTFDEANAFPLPEATSKDAALALTVVPGVYSLVVSGVGGGTGIVLIEVFELP